MSDLHKIVCVVGLLRQGHRILVRIRTPDPDQMSGMDGTFECPGGKVEIDESIMAGLRREVLEETGLVVLRMRLLEIYEEPRALTFLYRIECEPGAPETEVGKSEWVWRSSEEICECTSEIPTALLNWLGANQLSGILDDHLDGYTTRVISS